MSNLLIWSLLGFLIMNGFLWIWILFKSKSEEDIIEIVGKALVKGNEYHGEVVCNPSRKVIYLLEVVKKNSLIGDVRLLQSHIKALCNHLGVKIKIHLAEPERWVAVKKGGKK